MTPELSASHVKTDQKANCLSSSNCLSFQLAVILCMRTQTDNKDVCVIMRCLIWQSRGWVWPPITATVLSEQHREQRHTYSSLPLCLLKAHHHPLIRVFKHPPDFQYNAQINTLMVAYFSLLMREESLYWFSHQWNVRSLPSQQKDRSGQWRTLKSHPYGY